MEYVLILIIFGLSLIFLKFIFSYNIKKIEELAKSKNLTGIRMETWNFQARGFYEKKDTKYMLNLKTVLQVQ